MPTDESYLDSLLNGLSSGSEKKDGDRFSAYRKESKTEEKREEAVPQEIPEPEIPGFLNDFVTKEEKSIEFHKVPEEEFGNFYFEDNKATEEPVISIESETDDEPKTDGYNIFSDYDDEAIDRMIDEELSGDDKITGELFADFKNDDISFEDEEETPVDFFAEGSLEETAEEEPMDIFGESSEEENTESVFTEDNSGNSDDIFSEGFSEESSEEPTEEFAEEPSGDIFADIAAGEEAAEDVFADAGAEEAAEDVFADAGAEEATEDVFADAGAEEAAEDVFADAGAEEASEDLFADAAGLPDLDAGGDAVEDIFASASEEEQPAEEDPLSIFGSEEASEGEEKKESAKDLLGEMGGDTLNAEDIEALDDLFNEIDVDDSEDGDKKSKKKKEKKPWYIALFANVKLPENKIKPELSEEELEKKKAEAAEAKKNVAEAKKAAKEEKKKEAAEKKAEKAKQTAEEKEAAKAKKREEIEKLILEETDNTTQINKAGAFVIFAIFIGIAALIISGGSTISYKSTVKQAQRDYDNALIYQDVTFYEEAYNDIYGLELEEEDYKLGEKIYTVNFVSKQISSFNNHYALGDYTSGLDDLFKGLLRYNKWIPYAVELGAEDDLYFVRTQILELLKNNYDISEEEAMLVLSTYAGISETDGKSTANLYYTKYIYSAVGDVGLENVINND